MKNTPMKNTPMKKYAGLILILVSAFSYGSTLTPDSITDISSLQARWADIKYEMPEAEQEKALEQLIGVAESLREAHPSEAPYLIWEGIVRSTYASVKGGMDALSQVKTAKKLYEKAIDIEPDSLAGSAYTSLGTLYYRVPGWPVAFGSDEKAKEMLLKGLSYNPDGIDSNYFYGDYLLEQKQYAKALPYFEKALAAPAREDRQLADEGRKGEIKIAMEKAKKHL